MSEITKDVIKGCNVLNIPVSKVIIKEYREDDLPIYVYDLFGVKGELLAKDRYCIKDSDKQPFKTLTADEELILNPPYVESKEMI